MILGVFLTHQEIDLAQHKRLGIDIFIASHMIASLVIRQVKLIAAFNYGARDNSIVADPRIMTTESDLSALSKAMECPTDW